VPDQRPATLAAMSEALPPWHVTVEGCHNFRDAGGWPTVDGGRMRSGCFYRSDDARRITATGRATVESLGLALVLDLREHAQYIRRAGFLSPDRTTHMPLVDQVLDRSNPPPVHDEAGVIDLYDDMLTRGRGQISRAIDVIIDGLDRGPVLVHCAYGKDRAGLLTALVHALCGVSRDAIAEDFARSDAPSRWRREAARATPLPEDPDNSNLPTFLFTAKAGTMRGLLDRLTDRHGSLEEWTRSFDIADATVERLRSQLVTA